MITEKTKTKSKKKLYLAFKKQGLLKEKLIPKRCLGDECNVIVLSRGPHHRLCPLCSDKITYRRHQW